MLINSLLPRCRRCRHFGAYVITMATRTSEIPHERHAPHVHFLILTYLFDIAYEITT